MLRFSRLQVFAFCILVLTLVSLACSGFSSDPSDHWKVSDSGLARTAIARSEIQATPTPTAPLVELPILTPTPDAPRVLPTLRTEPEEYTVQSNDSLAQIAQVYGVRMETLIEANNLVNPDYLEIGQVLVIPAPIPGTPGPGFKIIPDSELVYGPGSIGFDVSEFVASQGGYLAGYQEEVEEIDLNGAQIVERIARDYSVNPRLLLAVLEYRSGWVTQPKPDEKTLEQPILVSEPWRKGLFLQLSWAANQLNHGYYLWRVNGLSAFTLANGELVPADSALNAGTAGVQYMFGLLLDRSQWEQAVSQSGLFQIYIQFFGYPFNFAFEPLLPANLIQPSMQLPFEPGKQWAFTGGPHGGWGEGSGWAALDFAPPGGALGCVQNDEWVTAVADGTIVRASQGAVIQDLDISGERTNDGLEQTGWIVLYMHVESRERVQPGDYVKAGDRIGHPSCEGGFSSGTHLHLARRYNGEWIAADQALPFVLDGWVSRGSYKEYDGFLQKEGQEIEAWEGYFPYNMIWR